MTITIDADLYTQTANLVWQRKEFSGINYSDGDEHEDKLYKFLETAQNVSLFSNEIRANCKDWVSTYHLSPVRSNLMRPLKNLFRNGKNVLEVGAGCGAITRFLGESNANVLALEGSQRRAAITKLRTKDLNNVEVICENFDCFTTKQTFDVVTFIGVLEYSNLFMAGDDPAFEAIKKAVSLLSESGHLIIAIENQLGLKYFAGYPEDHLSIPMFGIEGHYHKNQPETYGKHILEQKLKDAGLTNIEFLLPFPDYKLPVSILTKNGLDEAHFDASVFASNSVTKDLQTPKNLNFSLEQAWQTVQKNKLTAELANSFLIVASKDKLNLYPKNTLAMHYSTNRCASFCKETFFKKSSDHILVIPHLIQKNLNPEISSGEIEFIKPSELIYIEGTSLLTNFLSIVSRHQWTFGDIKKFFLDYYNNLVLILKDEGIAIEKDKNHVLPGEYLDAIPSNIIVSPEGKPFFFDREWKLREGVLLSHLIFRALISCLEHTSVFATSSNAPTTRKEFVYGIMDFFGFKLSNKNYQYFLEKESILSSFSSGLKQQKFISWSPESYLFSKSTEDLVAEKETVILNLEKLSINRLKQIHLQQKQIDSLHLTLEEVKNLSLLRLEDVQNLDIELKSRDIAIQKISEESCNRLEQIEKLDQRLRETDNTLQHITSLSVERLAKIHELDNQLKERDLALQQVSVDSMQRLEQIEKLDQRLRETDNALQHVTSISVARLAKIHELDNQLKERDLALQQVSVDSMQRLEQIEKLDQRLRETDNALQHVTSISVERLAKIHELDQQLKTTDQALTEVASTSLQRLAEIENLDRRLKETDSALVLVTELSLERLIKINELINLPGHLDQKKSSVI